MGDGERQRAIEALRFVARLDDIVTVDRFVSVALGGLAQLVPADLWGFNDLDPHSRDMVAFIWPPDAYGPEHFEAVAKVVWEHPVLRSILETGDGSPRRLSDHWTRDRYHASALYRDAYAAMRVEYQVAFGLADGPTATTIGFAANRHDADFTDDELELLQLLRPPLHAAWRRASASSALRQVVTATDGNRPLVLVDDRLHVIRAHPQAQALLASAGYPLCEGAQLPQPLHGWMTREARRSGAPLLLGHPPQVTVTVVAGSAEADRVLGVEEIPRERPGLATLTPRERGILVLVGEGLTDGQIASELGISPRTVQKHLERIYTKLGTTNRTAAARALRD